MEQNINLQKLKRYVEYRLNDNNNLVEMLKGSDITYEGAQVEMRSKGAIRELTEVKNYINKLLEED